MPKKRDNADGSITIEFNGYEYNEDVPEGCAACGNPDYPDCKDSCPMFDD